MKQKKSEIKIICHNDLIENKHKCCSRDKCRITRKRKKSHIENLFQCENEKIEKKHKRCSPIKCKITENEKKIGTEKQIQKA